MRGRASPDGVEVGAAAGVAAGDGVPRAGDGVAATAVGLGVAILPDADVPGVTEATGAGPAGCGLEPPPPLQPESIAALAKYEHARNARAAFTQ